MNEIFVPEVVDFLKQFRQNYNISKPVMIEAMKKAIFHLEGNPAEEVEFKFEEVKKVVDNQEQQQ